MRTFAPAENCSFALNGWFMHIVLYIVTLLHVLLLIIIITIYLSSLCKNHEATLLL